MDYGGAYYQDDGLGGLGGDDGLAGLGGSYAPPPATYEAPDMFADDGLLLGMPLDEEQQQQGQQGQQGQQLGNDDAGAAIEDDQELGDALDEALGLEPTQGTGSQLDSRTQQAASDFDDDEATDDEVMDVDGGDELTGPQVQEAQEPEDPAAAEAQRQNAWYKECFDAMTEAQRNRLEAYIRSNLQKKTMKKVLQELTGLTLNDRIVIAISSITKMFVGELVETARQVAARQGHSGALLPSHIRQAYNALSADGRVPHRAAAKPLRLR